MKRAPVNLLAMWAAMSTGASAQVVLRGGERIEEPVARVSVAGVEIGGARPRVLGWDVVRSVEGEHAQQAARMQPLSDALWRARARAERGDLTLAEPLFEQAFAQCYGVNGPTTLVASEGLLRCRLARGSHASALEPWLEALRLRRAGFVPAERAGEADIDDATGLAPALPPV